MKFQTLVLASLFVLATFSCKKEEVHNHEDMQVHTADEHSMEATKKLNVAVVNETDPVCGMNTAEFLNDTMQYEGNVYGFCSANCKEEFKKDPAQYAKK